MITVGSIYHPEKLGLASMLARIRAYNAREAGVTLNQDILYRVFTPGNRDKIQQGDILLVPDLFKPDPHARGMRLAVVRVADVELNESGHGWVRGKQHYELRAGDVFELYHLQHALEQVRAISANLCPAVELHVHACFAGTGFAHDPLNPQSPHRPCPICKASESPIAGGQAPEVQPAEAGDQGNEQLAKLREMQQTLLGWRNGKGLPKKLAEPLRTVWRDHAIEQEDLVCRIRAIVEWSHGRGGDPKLGWTLHQQADQLAYPRQI